MFSTGGVVRQGGAGGLIGQASEGAVVALGSKIGAMGFREGATSRLP
jgi:hypothetical protein